MVKGDFTLTLNKEVVEKHVTYRYLTVTNTKINKSQEVTHIHFNAWPDFDVPDQAAMQTLSKIIKNVTNKLMTQIDRL